MRTAVAFDSYDYVRKLRDVWVDERQAAIQAEAKAEYIKAELKRDIKELDGKIELSKAELSKTIETSKVDTIKWTAGMFVAQTALIIGAMFAGVKMIQPPLNHTPPSQEMRLPAHPVAPPSTPATK